MKLILRWVFAFALVTATYNPTKWNFVSWSSENWRDQLPLTLLIGLILLVGYIIYLRATLRSIGVVGRVLVLALLAALLWVLYDYGLMTLDNRNTNVWLGIIGLSMVLGVGLSWSHVRRALSGQSDMDDVDE